MPLRSLRFLLCLVLLCDELFVHWFLIDCEEDVNFLLRRSQTDFLFERKLMISLNNFDFSLIFLMRLRVSILCDFHTLNTSRFIFFVTLFHFLLWRWFYKSCWILLFTNNFWFLNHHFSLGHALGLLQIMRFVQFWILLIRQRLIGRLLCSKIWFFGIVHNLTLKLIRGRSVQFHSIFFILTLLSFILFVSLLCILGCHF